MKKQKKNMGLSYLKKRDYDNMKNLFIRNKYDFKEVRTSNRRYLHCKKTKFYLSDNPKKDMATKLLNHELGIIKNVKEEVIGNYMKNRYQYKDCININAYIGSKFDLFENFETEDIFEIDITAAYPSTAVKLGLLSQKTFDKFFLEETSTTHIARKMDIRKQYKDNSYFTGDTCLKYSKKCRLVSLGTLATKKEIDVFVGGVLIETVFDYDREIANLFYVCSYEVSKIMMQITEQVDGVYFYWVDAIFCKASAVEQVSLKLIDEGYKIKVKKLVRAEYNRLQKRLTISKNSLTDTHPYFFNLSNDIERMMSILDTEKDVFDMLDWYKDFLEFPELAREKIRIKAQTMYGPDCSIEKIIFTDLCDIIGIDSPQDLNLRYLTKVLNDRGLSYSDFIQIRSITAAVVSSMHLEEVFGHREDRNAADLISINVVIRSFKKTDVYKDDIEIKVGEYKNIGLSKIKTFTSSRLNTLDASDFDDFSIGLFKGDYTKIEKNKIYG
jgi:hypothetical protein